VVDGASRLFIDRPGQHARIGSVYWACPENAWSGGGRRVGPYMRLVPNAQRSAWTCAGAT
jgi:hypothetical protein